MALPSSGSLSLSQIQGEWGGSNPISLSEYYRGSLPTGRTNYGTIPYSGAIDIGDFYGTNRRWLTGQVRLPSAHLPSSRIQAMALCLVFMERRVMSPSHMG